MIFFFHSERGEKLDLTAENEAYILIHSLQDANRPKFLAEDVPLFESIMADLFPGIKPPEQDHGVLEVTHLCFTSLLCQIYSRPRNFLRKNRLLKIHV